MGISRSKEKKMKKAKLEEMKRREQEKKAAEEEKENKPTKTPKKSGKTTKKGGKKGKGKKADVIATKEVTFSNHTISKLARSLGPNDWIRLAYALGFLPQGVSHFTGRASSAQNTYSQCCLMLKTWRDLTDAHEILSRLCNALERIRRHDLALKVGLELAVQEIPKKDKKPTLLPELLELLEENPEVTAPPFEQSKVIFTNDRVSFLARQILAKEEWKRLAYALGFLPDEASQIIASASSSQNLYSQAHMMLKIWRDRTVPDNIYPSLRDAFVRIRRHDLVFLLNLGVILSPPDDDYVPLEDRLRALQEETKKSDQTLGSHIISKFKDLQL